MFTRPWIRQSICISAAVLMLLLLLGGNVPAAHAATLTVTSTADETTNGNGCSLREAIINANNNAATWVDCIAGSGADVINITATGTITLLAALPNLTEGLTINGPGASSLTVSGAGAVRVFQVLGAGAFRFENLTIANGSAMFGGGILVLVASVGATVNNVIFSNNAETGGAGGAIYNAGMNVTVTNSTFVGNHGYGGAINNDGGGMLTVTNSTFSGNVGDGHPASAIAQIGGGGVTTLNNVTISSSAPLAAIYVPFGRVTAQNTIIVNTAGATCQTVTPGIVVDAGYNIDSGATCGFVVANHSMNNTNPNLAPLANNGGPTTTIAIAAGSAALDKIPSAGGCGVGITTDQRGAGFTRPRPTAGLCDIGAYELQQADPQPPLPVKPAEVPEADTLLLLGGGIGGLGVWLRWQWGKRRGAK